MVCLKVTFLGILAAALATSAISIVHERNTPNNLFPDMEDLISAMKKASDAILQLSESTTGTGAAQIVVIEYYQIKDLLYKSVDDVVNIQVQEGEPKISAEEFYQLPVIELLNAFSKLVAHILGQNLAITSNPLIMERIPSFPMEFIDAAGKYADIFFCIVPRDGTDFADYYLGWKGSLKILEEEFLYPDEL